VQLRALLKAQQGHEKSCSDKATSAPFFRLITNMTSCTWRHDMTKTAREAAAQEGTRVRIKRGSKIWSGYQVTKRDACLLCTLQVPNPRRRGTISPIDHSAAETAQNATPSCSTQSHHLPCTGCRP
jgi:hypothetical protein